MKLKNRAQIKRASEVLPGDFRGNAQGNMRHISNYTPSLAKRCKRYRLSENFFGDGVLRVAAPWLRRHRGRVVTASSHAALAETNAVQGAKKAASEEAARCGDRVEAYRSAKS
jgi:hypothetical protein